MPNRGKKVVSSLSEVELRELWESGVSLDSAWVEFACFFDQFALRALRTHPNNDPDILHGDSRYQELKDWLPKVWEGRQVKLKIITKNERANLLGEIYTGRLWAIGFRTLANGSDELVRVPRQLFFVDDEGERANQPDIYWNKAELTVGSDSYFDIRIIDASVSTNEAPCGQGDDSPKKTENVAPVGRPNTSDEIREMVEELWKSDPSFQSLPDRTAQAGEVRARLLGEDARDAHDLVGYNTSTIIKIIGQVLNEPRKPE